MLDISIIDIEFVPGIVKYILEITLPKQEPIKLEAFRNIYDNKITVGDKVNPKLLPHIRLYIKNHVASMYCGSAWD